MASTDDSSNGNGSNGNRTNGNGSAFQGPFRQRIIYGPHEVKTTSFQEIIGIIYAHKLAVVLMFVVTVVAAIAYTFSRKPVYEATSKILITKNKGGSQGMLDGLSDYIQPLGLDTRRITDELTILQTNLMRDRVVQNLIENPIIKTELGSDTLQILLPPVTDKGERGRPFATWGEVASRLSSAVNFTNEPNSDVIDITARSHDPQEAALIANVYAKEYYDLDLNTSRTIATSMRKFLENQLNDAQNALGLAEDSLQNYMQSQHIISLDQESSKLIDALSTMEAQRDDVIVEMKTDQDLLDMYRAQLAKVERSFSAHVSDALDPYIALLQQQIAQLQVNRDVAIAQNPVAVNRNVYNQAVAQADSQIASLQRRLKEKTAEFLNAQVMAGVPSQQGQNGGRAGSYDPTGYYTDLRVKVLQAEISISSARAKKNALDGILTDYEQRLSKVPRQYTRLAQLERTEKSRSKLFLMLQDNFQQAQIAEQSQFGNVQIIEPATPPGLPASPRVPLNLALGVVLGLVSGVGFAFVLEQLDTSIKSPEDLEMKGFKVLSMLPLIPRVKKARRRSGKEKSVVVNGSKIPIRLVTLHSPSDPVSEAYLSLRTTLQHVMASRNSKSLLVVSALPREGKTTTIANLSVALANAGLKTLMLDADLRRPTLHKLWAVERKPGLVDYLKGKSELDAAIKKTSVKNLFILPAGSLPPNPSELIGSDSMKAAMGVLRMSFDIVLIDSPPVLAVTDAAILSQQSDAVLFVTSANRTRLYSVAKGSRALKQVEAKVIGYVLNEFDYRKAYSTYYDYNLYSRYYGRKKVEKVNNS